MTDALLTGTLVVAIVALAALVLQRAPTHSRCPNCGRGTRAVRGHRWLRPAEKLLRRRWCPSCGWEGRGRAGPEWIPGKPVAHDSGFHWGEERFPEDFGFRWARVPEADPSAPPPDHPSGFRFASDDPETDSAAHPSGFEWAPEESEPQEEPGASAPGTRAHPSGFRWSQRPPGDRTFTWAEPRRRGDPPPGFRWRGEGD